MGVHALPRKSVELCPGQSKSRASETHFTVACLSRQSCAAAQASKPTRALSMRDEIAWAKFCAATSAEYPLPLAAKGPPPQGEALNLYSLRILWPVIVSLVRAVPALVYAVCEAVWRCRPPQRKGGSCHPL